MDMSLVLNYLEDGLNMVLTLEKCHMNLVLQISSDRDDQMAAKIKTPKKI